MRSCQQFHTNTVTQSQVVVLTWANKVLKSLRRMRLEENTSLSLVKTFTTFTSRLFLYYRETSLLNFSHLIDCEAVVVYKRPKHGLISFYQSRCKSSRHCLKWRKLNFGNNRIKQHWHPVALGPFALCGSVGVCCPDNNLSLCCYSQLISITVRLHLWVNVDTR